MTSPPDLRQGLEAAIAALQERRALLGDALVDAALAPLLERLAALSAQPPSAAPAEPSRRLRQVSVLFLDIVGSTQLIQRLDPEEVQTVVDGALAAFSAIVQQHGGEVLRYAGDNLKVAFGAHDAAGTREDDAERAVHCGLALLAEAARRGDDIKRRYGFEGFNARVGIHTGGVVRGGGVENDKSLSGLAVNIAARLEQAAPAGALCISVDTYRQVQGLFNVKAQPALQVKGLQEPLQTYLVLGERGRRLRGLRHGVEGVASALVGRDAELAALRDLAAGVFSHGGLGAASVLGEAGLGKSRLLAEALAELQAALRADGFMPARTAALWSASSHPQGLNQPYGLLRDLLFWHHGVQDSDTQAQAQQKFSAALAPIFGAAAEEQTAMLGQLIGLDYNASPCVAGILRDGKQLRARGLHAWAQYLRLQAAQQPLVLVLDDLQWADDESLHAIDHLVAVSADLPLVVLCGARPELLLRRLDWASGWPVHQRLVLEPLAEPARQALAGALLQRLARPAPQLQALLSAQAAGNPYYMEALVQMLVDTGVIQTQAGGSDGPVQSDHWQVQDSQLQALQVPTSLVAVLQATLDALKPGERQSLQQASVVGAQFWNAALAAINPGAVAHLPALSQRELALPQARSSFEGTQEYAFRHHLLHQVTYGTVLKPDKREGHRQAALWLQARSTGREAETASHIAEHFERAGSTGQAEHYWLLAAEDASRRQADTVALAHAERALALDDGTDLQRRVRIYRVRTNVAERRGDAAATALEIAELNRLAQRLDDDLLRLEVAKHQMWRHFQDGQFEAVLALGTERIARVAGRSPVAEADVRGRMLAALIRLGRTAEALAYGQEGLGFAQVTGNLSAAGALSNHLGVMQLESHGEGLGQAHFQRSLEAYTAAGDRHGAITARVNLATREGQLGNLAVSRDLHLRNLQDCQETGNRSREAMVCANLSHVLYQLGDLSGAESSALRGLRVAEVTGDRWAEAFAASGAHLAAYAEGRFPEALAYARRAHQAFADYSAREEALTYRSAVACTLQAMGQQAAARDNAEAVIADVAEQGGWGEAIDGPLFLHRVLAAQEDPRASTLLMTASQNLDALAERYSALVPRERFVRTAAAWREIGDALATTRRA